MYSMVLTELPSSVNVMTIQNFNYQTDENGVRVNERGTPLGRYATQNDYQVGIATPTLAFRTLLQYYDQHKETPYSFNSLNRLLNENQSAAYWHNGDVDKSSTFRGLHLHIIIQCHVIHGLRVFKTLKSNFGKEGSTVRVQKNRSLQG